MAYKEVHRVEISEVIRRWQAGNSQRSKATGTGLSRETVRRCAEVPCLRRGRLWRPPRKQGVAQEGPAATADQRSVLASVSRSGPREPEAPSEEKLAPWSDQIYQWLTEDQLQFTRIQELLAERGCRISYSSPAPVAKPAPLAATPQRQHGADGGGRPWGSGRTGLRPPGLHPGPGDRPPLRSVGPAGGAGPLQTQLPVAQLQPEAGGGDRRPGGGLGLLRRHTQIPGHRQLPRRGGRGRFPASPPDSWLPGILPSTGASSPIRPGVRHPRDKPKVERGVQ